MAKGKAKFEIEISNFKNKKFIVKFWSFSHEKYHWLAKKKNKKDMKC